MFFKFNNLFPQGRAKPKEKSDRLLVTAAFNYSKYGCHGNQSVKSHLRDPEIRDTYRLYSA